MAQTNQQPDNGINTSILDYMQTMSQDTEGTLKSIDLILKQITKPDGIMISQSSLQDMVVDAKQPGNRKESGNNKNAQNKRSGSVSGYDGTFSDSKYAKSRARHTIDSITDDIEKGFTEAIFGNSAKLKNALAKSVDAFAKSLGTDVDHLGKEMGKRLAKKSPNGRRLKQSWDNLKEPALNKASDMLNKRASSLFGVNPGINLSELMKEDRSDNDPKVKDVQDAVNKGCDTVSETIKQTTAESTEQVVENIKDMSSTIQGMTDRLQDFISLIESLLGRELTDSEKQSFTPPSLSGEQEEIIDADYAEVALSEGVDSVKSDLKQELSTEVMGAAGEAANALLTGGATFSEALGGFMSALGPMLAEIAIPLYVISELADAIGPVIKSVLELFKGLGNAFNYQTNKARELMKLQRERVTADAEVITKAAFNVIKESANKVTDTWSNVFATVVTSQGYTKSGVQDLWSSYAQRLKDEGLSSVVSSADIMESLEKVLSQGLSGQVAEEFAYQATLLGGAVKEDFFDYASTYASLAANAIKNGADQEEAIQAANAELRAFASNLLYAKREIAGGFTTSLSHGADLFEQSAKIALTSRTGDVSDISGVLTSVSAIVGATAPDLVSNIVDAVVNAATGGNDSSITALRSLAGVGASNTAFLQAFAKDPKKVFSTLFTNLSQLQNMSSANYMEVAEALSSTFGISLDSFARVDFAYLADAINSMNLNNESLEQNLELLAEGQTTSTDAQLRMQKINEYMVDQGLAYVLDNEVARSIQEHMWQEQLSQQIMENQFAVDLTGSALDLFNNLAVMLQKIVDLINPLSWVKKAGNLILKSVEASEMDDRVKNLLQAVKVGAGNQTAFHNLTTSGTELGLATRNSYLDWLGTSGESSSFFRGLATGMLDYAQAGRLIGMAGSALGIPTFSGLMGSLTDITGKMMGKSGGVDNTGYSGANSYYTHKLISKGAASTLKSGDWRDNIAYNALYGNFEESGTKDEEGARTQQQAQKLSQDLQDSIAKYVQSSADSSSSLDNLKRTVSDLSLLVADSTNPLIERDIDELQESLKNKNLTKGAEAGLAHRSYYTQAELTEKVAKELADQASSQSNSFQDWLTKFEKESGIKNLAAELSMYSETMETVEAIYNEQQTAQSSAAAKARELHEVQFWEDMQQFATKDFPWYMREWERYYIQHEAYGNATQQAQESAIELKDMQQNEFGDAIFKLAEQLVQNSNWQEEMAKELKDPAVQTNALLAQIVLIVDAIRQQNNETSIVSVPTALSSLGLGLSKSKV